MLLLGDMTARFKCCGDSGEDEEELIGLSKFQIRMVPSPEKVANEFNGIALSSRSTVGHG